MKLRRIKVTEQLLKDKEHLEDYYTDQLGVTRYIGYHCDHVVVETESNIAVLKVGDYLLIPI
jgi:hypothetical protein